MQLTQPTLTSSLAPSIHLSSVLLPVAVPTSRAALTESQRQSLAVAREGLLSLDKPQLLRVVYYLRISCAVMRSSSSAAGIPRVSFTRLLQLLYAHDSQWWKHCQATADGQLTSDDAVIDQLLLPVNALHHL